MKRKAVPVSASASAINQVGTNISAEAIRDALVDGNVEKVAMLLVLSNLEHKRKKTSEEDIAEFKSSCREFAEDVDQLELLADAEKLAGGDFGTYMKVELAERGWKARKSNGNNILSELDKRMLSDLEQRVSSGHGRTLPDEYHNETLTSLFVDGCDISEESMKKAVTSSDMRIGFPLARIYMVPINFISPLVILSEMQSSNNNNSSDIGEFRSRMLSFAENVSKGEDFSHGMALAYRPGEFSVMRSRVEDLLAIKGWESISREADKGQDAPGEWAKKEGERDAKKANLKEGKEGADNARPEKYRQFTDLVSAVAKHR